MVTLVLYLTVSEIWPMFSLKNIIFLILPFNSKFENASFAPHCPNFANAETLHQVNFYLCKKVFTARPTAEPQYIGDRQTDRQITDVTRPVSESGSEGETERAKASEIFPVSERQYIQASRSEQNSKQHDFSRATSCNAFRILVIVESSVCRCLSVYPSHSATVSKRC